jgi:hypothetical protein
MDKITEKQNKGCVEPWWKGGRSDHEWVNFFSNIQNLGVSGSITKKQVEDFFSIRENNK